MYLQVKRAAMALFLSLICFAAFAQKTVTGTVKDATGEPMIGVSVVVDGTSIGSVTDLDGNFTIQKVPENATLKISYVGYKEQKLQVAGKSSFQIVMDEDNQGLDEVVVIGYGTVKKRDLTGSVASVKQNDIAQVAAPDAMQAMQAKVPGLDLVSGDGQAGSSVSITLRGNRSISASNNPLIIVDGVEYSGALDIPANDIESMDILKDASSTAIYGTKGANGVIIITTKRGQAGKTRVNFSAYLAMKSPTSAVKSMYGKREVQRWIDRANYQADLESGNWGSSNKTLDEVFGATTIAGNDNYKVVDLINAGDYTDWYDTILENTTSQNYEASVSGGNDKTNFSLSLAAMYDKGLLKHDAMDRYNGRFNIDHIINQYVKVGGSMAFTYRSHNARNASVFDRARKMTSITQAYKADGTVNETPNVWYNAHVNPLMDEGDNFKSHIESTRYLGSAYVQLTPIKGLSLKSQLAVDRRNRRNGQYSDYQSTNRFQAPSNTYMSNNWDVWTILTWQNTANYNLTLNEKHDFTFLLGHELSQDVTEGLGYNGTAGKEHYYQQAFYDVSKISADQSPSSSYSKNSMLSYFARVNYAFMDRYLFSASLRADGSSVLAEGKKWGYFPSVSAGWRITEESFMESTRSWLDNLKLRVAWGVSGNAAVKPYQTLATVSATTPNSSDSFIPMSMSNPDLSWETTSSFNLGLDFGIIGGRINGTIDYYWTKTKDLLYYRSAPSSSVFTSILSNIGESKGQGLEIGINAQAIKTKDFNWEINASYTHSKDEISKLADGLERNIDGTTALIVGEPLRARYDYETNGIWNVGEYEKYVADYKARGIDFAEPLPKYGTPGTMKIVDQNGDGKIDEDDKRVYKLSPDHIFGLTNTFTYKDFALSIQCMARLGGYFGFDKNNALGLNDGDANWADVDYWTPTNTGAKFPSPGTNSTDLSKLYTQYASALLWEKNDFFKIKDITLSYNVNKDWLKHIHVASAKIYCSLKNYFTFASVKDYDPERGGSINWPLAKQVIVGVNVSF
ncbi:MAG: TonB-dependent receptor [Prevotella sp.]|nr:TonB-dependent receptor [Prevotella sp.]MBQ2196195.1 TonB-dependent receptor [Prevotella sp.]